TGKRTALETRERKRLFGRARGARFDPATTSDRRRSAAQEKGRCAGSIGVRHLHLAVDAEEIADDIGGLVKPLTGVLIDEEGEERFSADGFRFGPKSLSASRTRPNFDVEMERRE